MRTNPPPPNSIKAKISYDPETGVFSRLDKKGKPRKKTGGLNSKGYFRLGYAGRKYLGHALAWWFFYGEWPTSDIDHRNLDRTDNRIVNLRLATPAQNMANRRPHRSGPKGATRLRSGKWQAQIKVGGKVKYLGSFATEADAASAYANAAASVHGEFARLN